jgi:predicted nucleotidyltransferase
LRIVAAYLNIDQAILSKIERGKRKPPREIVIKLSEYFNVDKKELLAAWLSDKVLYEIADEEQALEALKVAEEQVKYKVSLRPERTNTTKEIVTVVNSFPQVKKAWIFGSFSREEDNANSDVDIAIQTEGTFSYFDLADIQHRIEKRISRKADIGFIDSLREDFLKRIQPEMKLIYER